MRTPFFTMTAFAVLLATGTASAQDTMVIDVDNVCKKGCTILLKFPESAKISADAKADPGEFLVTSHKNPMQFFTGLLTNDSGRKIFMLLDEPGTPMFRTIGAVTEFMVGHNNTVRDSRTQGGS